MIFARFTNIGASSFTKPVFLFSLVCLTLSLIFSSLILAGGTDESPTLRKFYLVSFKYDPNSAFYKTYEKYGEVKDKVEDVKDKVEKEVDDTKDKVEDTFDKVNPFRKRADEQDPSFNMIRVSYRGLCVEHSEGWDCAPQSDKLPEQDLQKDPLKLVEIADLYKDKILWSAPFWVTVAATAIAYLMVLANCIPIPAFTPPFWTKKIAVVMLGIAGIACLGGMVLGQVTTDAVSKLVDKVTMGAIIAHKGRMVVTFGWVSFALVLVSFLGVAGVSAAEWSMLKAQERITHVVEKHVGTTASSFVDVEGVGNHHQTSSGPRAAAGGFAGLRNEGIKANVGQVIGLARSLRK